MGDGVLLFPNINQVTEEFIIDYLTTVFIIFTCLRNTIQLTTQNIKQIHQGEYVCRADNGIGSGQEEKVQLYLQGRRKKID